MLTHTASTPAPLTSTPHAPTKRSSPTTPMPFNMAKQPHPLIGSGIRVSPSRAIAIFTQASATATIISPCAGAGEAVHSPPTTTTFLDRINNIWHSATTARTTITPSASASTLLSGTTTLVASPELSARRANTTPGAAKVATRAPRGIDEADGDDASLALDTPRIPVGSCPSLLSSTTTLPAVDVPIPQRPAMTAGAARIPAHPPTELREPEFQYDNPEALPYRGILVYRLQDAAQGGPAITIGRAEAHLVVLSREMRLYERLAAETRRAEYQRELERQAAAQREEERARRAAEAAERAQFMFETLLAVRARVQEVGGAAGLPDAFDSDDDDEGPVTQGRSAQAQEIEARAAEQIERRERPEQEEAEVQHAPAVDYPLNAGIDQLQINDTASFASAGTTPIVTPVGNTKRDEWRWQEDDTYWETLTLECHQKNMIKKVGYGRAGRCPYCNQKLCKRVLYYRERGSDSS